ncbi:hypothetical protein R1sor_003768 [Riccia sorocarpa]|uniref:DUF7869 domain-containing protein n=1 Tax=Riccia sorocarpa TaxID=122646 RepID=A0ABD3H4C4_9MARC
MAGIFKVGDRVYLRKPNSNNAVGHGTVVSVLPTFRVHTIPLGTNSIAVRVDRVDDYLHPLPLQSMDATHLGEIELGMNVRWPRDLLRQFSMADDPIASIGGSGVSKSLFYTTWASTYKNYKFHKRGAFAKCDTCIKLKLQLMEERRPDFRRPIEEERNEHMREQMSRRSVYYAKRALAKAQPERYLCIIHDKMDQAKTNIPRLADNMKRLHIGGCIPLPINLTGMLTHGREPGIVCHLSLTGLWPGDPNFTVSSLAGCIRDLEQVPDNGDHTGDLSRTTSNQSLFTCLLDQTTFKATLGREGAVDSTYFELHGSGSEPTAATDTLPTTFTKLPRAFLLQMDNSAKDNKNIHVLAFCSELVKRGIFEIVEVNFLMVGHTHEDIDALFSKVSARTINKDVLTLPTLMAEIWESEAMHPVPLLLEEVADYKSYVGGLLDKLEGHSQPIGFRFSMANNVPIYKFQAKVDGPWMPEGGHSLWKKRNGQFIFPEEEPRALQLPSTHPRLGFMTYAQYEDGLRVEQDEPGLDELERELQAENEIQLQPYVGPPSLRPKRAFVPLEDICEGKFVVLRPEDDFEAEVPRAVWLGRVMGAVVRDNNDEHHGQFQIEWWRPRHRKSTNATNKERYSSLLVGQKDWEKDPGYNTPHWINASAAIYSWKYRAKEGVPLIAKLNPLAKAAINSHFEKLDANEGRE